MDKGKVEQKMSQGKVIQVFGFFPSVWKGLYENTGLIEYLETHDCSSAKIFSHQAPISISV